MSAGSAGSESTKALHRGLRTSSSLMNLSLCSAGKMHFSAVPAAAQPFGGFKKGLRTLSGDFALRFQNGQRKNLLYSPDGPMFSTPQAGRTQNNVFEPLVPLFKRNGNAINGIVNESLISISMKPGQVQKESDDAI